MWLEKVGIPSCDCGWAVFNLSQNPSGNLSWSATSYAVPCVTTKPEKMWVDSISRWLTLKELQTAMGQCAYDSYARQARVVTMDLSHMPYGHGRFVLGNSIHVGVAGVVLASALASARPRNAAASSSSSKRRRLM